MNEIEIIKPDDWHIHFRDDEIMKAVVPETTRYFSRGMIMPNLLPPVLNENDVIRYRKQIEMATPENDNFKPFMTIYLTEKTNKNDLKVSFKNRNVFGAKLYPAGATTNSDSGVKDLKKIMPLLEVMAEVGMPLLIHGEVTDQNVDIFDREKIFIEKKLDFICRNLPELKITLEHITTKDAISYIKESNKNIAASITPHHLALNRNAMFIGGIRPHNYCLPILKRDEHRQSLVKAAISGNSKFFLGTDSAPHLTTDKESACGCAGVFNATYCLSILAQIFDNNKSMYNLEKFTSINGARHYGLETNDQKIKLFKLKKRIVLKELLNINNKYKIRIFDPDFPIFWKTAN